MVATYSPKRVILTIYGKQIQGFSDNDMVTVVKDEDSFAKYIAVDGEVSRSHNPSSSGKFTITLNQTSPANQLLSTLLLADIADNTGKLVFGVSLRDLNSSGTFYYGHDCWVSKMPDSGFNKAIGTREWVIETKTMFYNVSGYKDGNLLTTIFG